MKEQRAEDDKDDDGEAVGGGGDILVVEFAEHVVHVVLQRIDGLVRVGAADEVDLLEDLEGVDPREHEHEKGAGHHHGQRDGERLAEKARALQTGVFIQGLGDGLQRRQKDDHGKAEVFPHEHEDDRHAQRRPLQPGNARKPQRRDQTVDDAAIIEQHQPDQQHRRGGHQIGHEDAVAEERPAGFQAVQEHGDDEGQRPHQRRADQRQFQRVFQPQQEHLVFPDVYVVLQADKGVFITAVGEAVIDAADERHDVEQRQADEARQQVEKRRALAGKHVSCLPRAADARVSYFATCPRASSSAICRPRPR